MISLTNRNSPWLCSSLLAVFGILGFAFGTIRGQDAKGMKEIYAINAEWEQLLLKAADARRNAKSPIELERAQKRLCDDGASVGRALPGPGTQAARRHGRAYRTQNGGVSLAQDRGG